MLGTSKLPFPSTLTFSPLSSPPSSLLSNLLIRGRQAGYQKVILPSCPLLILFSLPLPFIFKLEGTMLGTSKLPFPHTHSFLLLPPPFPSRLLIRHFFAVYKQRGIPFYPLHSFSFSLFPFSLFSYPPPPLYLMRRRDTVFQHIVLPFYTLPFLSLLLPPISCEKLLS